MTTPNASRCGGERATPAGGNITVDTRRCDMCGADGPLELVEGRKPH